MRERNESVIEMPEIGTYAEVAAYLRLSRKTVYKMCSQDTFRKGVYLGRGRFNLSRLKECIEKNGTYLRDKRA